MAARVGLDVRWGRVGGEPGTDRRPEKPMRILIFADFSGRGGRLEGADRPPRRAVEVDADNFDAVMMRLAPRVRAPSNDPEAAEVTFGCLEDFHPDALYLRLDVFRPLRESRGLLLDPRTFSGEAARLWPAAGIAARSDESPQPSSEDLTSTLERLLGRRPVGAAAKAAAAQGTVARLLEAAVRPHVVPAPPPGQRECVGLLEREISERLRALLHDSAFQALESAWRGLRWLVTGLETGEDLRVFLLDAAKAELPGLLRPEGPTGDCALRRLLLDPDAPDNDGWALLAGDYGFGAAPADLALLEALGEFASRVGAPFLAAGDLDLLGCRSPLDATDPSLWQLPPEVNRAWEDLRRSEAAPWIGLALPRILLRLPYGARSEPIESFPFEELTSAAEQEAYLWGNPAFACALLLGKTFAERGWQMEPGDLVELEGLPAFTYEEDGEVRLRPCGEVRLTERAAQAILTRGVMPILSYPNRNAARLVRFQSIADPPAPLAGPWG